MKLQPIVVTGLAKVGKWTFGHELAEIIDETKDTVMQVDETDLAYQALQMCGAKANTPIGNLTEQLTNISISTGELFNYFDSQIRSKLVSQDQEEADGNLTMYVIIQTKNPAKLESSLNRVINSYIGDDFKGEEIEVMPIISVLLRRKKITDITLTNEYLKMNFDYKFDISEGKEHTKQAAKGFYDMIK